MLNEETDRDNKRIDFYRRHSTSRSNDRLAVHRMIGSFPIVAHNQQYTLDILDSRSVDMISTANRLSIYI